MSEKQFLWEVISLCLKNIFSITPAQGGPEAKKAVKALQESNPKAVVINICRITSYTTFFNGLEPDASVILCGGDGTLNRFINDVDGIKIQNKLLLLSYGNRQRFCERCRSETIF